MNIEEVIVPQSSARLENDFRQSVEFKESVDTAPTNPPITYDEQIVIYKNATTYRLYVYVDDTWRYVALT